MRGEDEPGKRTINTFPIGGERDAPLVPAEGGTRWYQRYAPSWRTRLRAFVVTSYADHLWIVDLAIGAYMLTHGPVPSHVFRPPVLWSPDLSTTTQLNNEAVLNKIMVLSDQMLELGLRFCVPQLPTMIVAPGIDLRVLVRNDFVGDQAFHGYWVLDPV